MTPAQMKAMQSAVFAPMNPRKAVSGWLVAGPVEALHESESERCPARYLLESLAAGAVRSGAIHAYAQSEEGRAAASARGHKRWRVCPTHRRES